jgi:hypothetical protein
MQLIDSPDKLVLPFADAGAKNAIPVASQIGITAGAASLTDGFPPLTRTPLAAGGTPPSGLDMNGILYELSAILRWANAGGGYVYDPTFATDPDVDGYPQGARVLRSDGMGYWFNTVDGNDVDPEVDAAAAIAAGWVPDFTSGVTAITMTDTNVTMTPLQYGKRVIVISGLLTGDLNLIFPTGVVDQWSVINNTTGPYTVTCKTVAGTGVVVNSVQDVIGDGTNIYGGDSDAISTLSSLVAIGDGTADAITATFSPAARLWPTGVPFFARAASANATTTPTFTANSGTLTAKTIVKGANVPLAVGDIAGAGHWLVLQYDVTLDKVVLLNPASGLTGTRERLTGARTLYVATTGSDSNNGLTVGAPFLTIQKAWTVIRDSYDLNGFAITVQLADGTYTAGLNAAGHITGAASESAVTFKGNAATPANVIVSTTSANAFAASSGAQIIVRDMKLKTTTSGSCLSAIGQASLISFTNLIFDAINANSTHINSQLGARVVTSSAYSIIGGAYAHYSVSSNAMIDVNAAVTVTGTPAFTSAFVVATILSGLNATGSTFTGSATGVRYSATLNAVINTNGGGGTFFPGNSIIAPSTGGQYA